MPFTEVITQMPLYAKILKDILSKKRKIVEEGIVNLTETCSAVIKRGLPEKMKDPGSFNLIRSLRNLDIERDDIKSVEDVFVNNFHFYYDCNDYLSINEKEMNFQYPEGFDLDFLHINLHSTEKVMSLEQNGIKQRDKNEEKEFHQETSEEGLVLKELPSHLKYAYLELPRNKPVIISARLSDAEEQRLLEILRKHKESIA